MMMILMSVVRLIREMNSYFKVKPNARCESVKHIDTLYFDLQPLREFRSIFSEWFVLDFSITCEEVISVRYFFFFFHCRNQHYHVPQIESFLLFVRIHTHKWFDVYFYHSQNLRYTHSQTHTHSQMSHHFILIHTMNSFLRK